MAVTGTGFIGMAVGLHSENAQTALGQCIVLSH